MMNRVCSVLVVDDEPLPRKLISDRISKIPDVVLAASLSNGQSAKEYLLQHTVDMVITDIKMPVSDGLDLAEFVQQLDPLCTTVIISGYSEFEYAKKALQFGVQDYLLKPVQFSQVAEAVERCRKSAVMIRKQQMISRGSELDSLDGAIQQTFLGNTPAKSWHQPVDALIPQGADVLRIVPTEEETGKPKDLAVIFRNILQGILNNPAVLNLRYGKVGYEYLIARKQQESVRSLSAVPERMNSILNTPVVVSEIASVQTAQELAALSCKKGAVKRNSAIEVACEYMKIHLDKPLTRDEVANQVYLSPSYFGQLFKRTVGMGYSEYLTELRIRQAKKILRQNLSVREVAAAVGFQDAKYFSEIFVKRTGYVPSEYRRALLNGEISQEDCHETDKN